VSDDKLTTLYFASSSRNKYEDYQFLLGQYADLRWQRLIVDETMTVSPDIFIRRKIENVKPFLPHLPFLVEQTGLIVDAWTGLPGILTGLFMDAIGNDGICRMMESYPDKKDRAATALTDLGYHGSDGRVEIYRGVVHGRIATSPRGDRGFGWDPIFIPEGHDETMAEMSMEKKHSLSTRMLAVTSFYTAVLDDSQAGSIAQNRIQLRQLIDRHFNKAELEELCFIMGLDPEDVLPDSVKREQVREMILYCDRHGLVPDLLRACHSERPKVSWPAFV
jgi:XTP/dITP diphosphohydrolase